jgi:hypothetical protein
MWVLRRLQAAALHRLFISPAFGSSIYPKSGNSNHNSKAKYGDGCQISHYTPEQRENLQPNLPGKDYGYARIASSFAG